MKYIQKGFFDVFCIIIKQEKLVKWIKEKSHSLITCFYPPTITTITTSMLLRAVKRMSAIQVCKKDFRKLKS